MPSCGGLPSEPWKLAEVLGCLLGLAAASARLSGAADDSSLILPMLSWRKRRHTAAFLKRPTPAAMALSRRPWFELPEWQSGPRRCIRTPGGSIRTLHGQGPATFWQTSDQTWLRYLEASTPRRTGRRQLHVGQVQAHQGTRLRQTCPLRRGVSGQWTSLAFDTAQNSLQPVVGADGLSLL